jgi:anthranilate synthase component 1
VESDYSDLPDAIFLMTDTLVAFDHAFGRLLLIANASLDEDEDQGFRSAQGRLDELQDLLYRPLPVSPFPSKGQVSRHLRSNMSSESFTQAVLEAKEHIAAGDIFQVVLSQRFSRETHADPFTIYRALRRLNPSPYMFFFDFADLASPQPLRLIGASPEMHVRLEAGCATLRPIAGTRSRGHTPAEDQALEEDLHSDEKERRARHVVDLARNDLGRVCNCSGVTVPADGRAPPHVIRIVHSEGELRDEHDNFSLMAPLSGWR